MELVPVGQFGRKSELPLSLIWWTVSVLDPQQNPNLLSELRPNVVFIGLNTSKDIHVRLEPFSNFHPTNPFANDYKTRNALKDAELWVGYMTDIIKEVEELHSISVVKHLI